MARRQYNAAVSVALPIIDALPRQDLSDLLERLSVGRVHTEAVFAAMHRDHVALTDVPELGYRKRERLLTATRRSAVELTDMFLAEDGTEKLRLRVDGGAIEAVLIPGIKGRVTLCVSSQIGCAMACTFCATGTLGLTRGLTAGEIVQQVHLATARASERGLRLNRLVFMGMGEPLHHYANTRDALRILTDRFGPMLPHAAITVSTVGLAPRIRQLATDFEGRIQLALSLNAGTNATRAAIMPLTDRHDLGELKAALQDYPLPGPRRTLLLEYVLLAGVTDTEAELMAAADWASGLRCVINLIPFNTFPGALFESPDTASVDRAYRTLSQAGHHVTVRRPRGRREQAACGQLACRSPQ